MGTHTLYVVKVIFCLVDCVSVQSAVGCPSRAGHPTLSLVAILVCLIRGTPNQTNRGCDIDVKSPAWQGQLITSSHTLRTQSTSKNQAHRKLAHSQSGKFGEARKVAPRCDRASLVGDTDRSFTGGACGQLIQGRYRADRTGVCDYTREHEQHMYSAAQPTWARRHHVHSRLAPSKFRASVCFACVVVFVLLFFFFACIFENRK